MLALIDGDIPVYRVGFTTEQEDFNIAKFRFNEMIEDILNEIEANRFTIYLSDSTENGFRKHILPSYKENRTKPKPRHYDALKEYAILEWGAKVTPEQEADDALGIHQTSLMTADDDPDRALVYESTICSIDKDLLQIPGRHYDFVKREIYEVSPEQGRLNFYRQLIMGDPADNIKGVYGLGKVKTARLFAGLPDTSEKTLFEIVVNAYRDWLRKEWCPTKEEVWDDFKEHQMMNLILITGRVLKIRQKEGELWNFPMEFSEQQPSLDSQP